MVGRHVEDSSGLKIERSGRLELIAGQLEDIELSRLRVAIGRGKQIKRGLAEIAANTNLQPGPFRHAPDERRYRALAVGASDADDRRIHGAREHFDVAHDLESPRLRLDEEGLSEGDARGSDDVSRMIEKTDIESTDAHRDLGKQDPQPIQLGRLSARIRNGQTPTQRVQMARAGQAGLPETNDHSRSGFGGGEAHLSFRVARPKSTRMSEMIQKRTITFGSAQPFNSK